MSREEVFNIWNSLKCVIVLNKNKAICNNIFDRIYQTTIRFNLLKSRYRPFFPYESYAFCKSKQNSSKMWFFCCCAVHRYEGLKLHPVLSDCDEIYAVQRSDILIELIKHHSKNACYKVTKFINVLNLFNPTIVNSYIAGFIFEN